ncbi:MAG: formylmethanofuran dehydrogenase subunit E family protein [Euryarchaeota archaeon]|nr:formylmethanofuran dehydrogenase subunit E family protein [Euryarchaeota archaeon]
MHAELPPELKALSSFHGHLGPYVVVGYRMGQIARSELKGKIKAIVFTGSKTPLSCVIDGVQFSSGCTMGKGNISVKDDFIAKASFSSVEGSIEIELREDVKHDIDSTMSHETEEQIALSIHRASADSMFLIKRAP